MNGSATGADSSGCGSAGSGSREAFDFETFNRLKAPPAFDNGNVLGRIGEFHAFSSSET
jgi:hypothetical protein